MWLLINFITIGLLTLCTAFVFVFWFIYLIKPIRKQWNKYKNSQKYKPYTDCDFQEETALYNTETELKKYIFLFFINIVEWLAFFYNSILYLYEVFQSHKHCLIVNNNNNSVSAHEWLKIPCFLTATEMHYSSYFFSSILFLGDNLLVLSLILIACLCEYLAARYAQKSWMKTHNQILLISVLVAYMAIIQIMSLFCSIAIITKWFNTFLFTLAFCLAVTQYRKLNMVIKWTIVDLEISKVNKRMLKKIIAQKRAFNFMFKFIWVGTGIMIAIEYIRNVLLIAKLVLDQSSSLNFDISLCYNEQNTNSIVSDVINLSLGLDNIISTIGFVIYFIPYIGVGITEIYTQLWRQVKYGSANKIRFREQRLY